MTFQDLLESLFSSLQRPPELAVPKQIPPSAPCGARTVFDKTRPLTPNASLPPHIPSFPSRVIPVSPSYPQAILELFANLGRSIRGEKGDGPPLDFDRFLHEAIRRGPMSKGPRARLDRRPEAATFTPSCPKSFESLAICQNSVTLFCAEELRPTWGHCEAVQDQGHSQCVERRSTRVREPSQDE